MLGNSCKYAIFINIIIIIINIIRLSKNNRKKKIERIFQNIFLVLKIQYCLIL